MCIDPPLPLEHPEDLPVNSAMTYLGSMSNFPTFPLQMSAGICWALYHTFGTRLVHFAPHVPRILLHQTPAQRTPRA